MVKLGSLDSLRLPAPLLPGQCVAICLLCPVSAVVPARQPHLLDSSGQINRQLLERGSNPLVFTSLVLKTSLGTYIQVREHSLIYDGIYCLLDKLIL